MSLARVRAPRGWKPHALSEHFQDGAGTDFEAVTLFEMADLAPGELTLDQQARVLLDQQAWLRRLPDVELDGERVLHLAGRPTGFAGRVEHVFAVNYRDHGVILRVRAYAKHVEEVVASVIATFEWKR